MKENLHSTGLPGFLRWEMKEKVVKRLKKNIKRKYFGAVALVVVMYVMTSPLGLNR